MNKDDILDIWDDHKPWIIGGLIVLIVFGVGMAAMGYMIAHNNTPAPARPTITPIPSISPDHPSDYIPGIATPNPNIYTRTMAGANGYHQQDLGVIRPDTPAFYANWKFYSDELPAITEDGHIYPGGYYNRTMNVLKYYFIPQNKSDLECRTAGDLDVYWGEQNGYVDRNGKYHDEGYYAYRDNTATVYAIYNGSMVQVIIP